MPDKTVAIVLSTIRMGVYLNPFNNQLYIDIGTENTSKLDVRIFDIFGRLCYTESTRVKQGFNPLVINKLAPCVLEEEYIL